MRVIDLFFYIRGVITDFDLRKSNVRLKDICRNSIRSSLVSGELFVPMLYYHLYHFLSVVFKFWELVFVAR